MAKILVQLAHPLLEKSRVQKKMLQHAKMVKGVTFNDLYEHYPDFDIDIKREQQLLLSHDIIIFQHPFYWYSGPAMIKQWLDLVLEHGWAYGKNGKQLQGKSLMVAISCGGSEKSYSAEGRNRFSIRQMLAPMEQTAGLCLMQYLPPYVVFGTHRLQDAEIELHALQYTQILTALKADLIQPGEWQPATLMNELYPIPELLEN